MPQITLTSSVESTAIKSDCGRYRYVLKRVWESEKRIGAFLCANPSKADHLQFDETVFKCINLAVNWRWGGLYILNLYPLYEKDPKKLVHDAETDRVNAEYIVAIFREMKEIVLATGNGHEKRLRELINGVPANKLFCLRKNKGGGFLHPSRIKPDDFPQPVSAQICVN